MPGSFHDFVAPSGRALCDPPDSIWPHSIHYGGAAQALQAVEGGARPLVAGLHSRKAERSRGSWGDAAFCFGVMAMPELEPESEPELSFEEASTELGNWTKSLGREVDSSLVEIREILGKSNGKTFPSRRQQALLVFRKVKEKLSEVTYMVKAVDKAIRKSGKH